LIPNASNNSQAKPMTTDALLVALAKSNYLDRQRTSGAGDASSSGPGRKRTAAAASADGEGGPTNDDYEWKWGTRSIAEINEMGVAKMVQEFMGEQFRVREVREEGAVDDDGVKSQQQLKHEKAVMTDLMRGAGGALLEDKNRERRDEEDED
jgi:hypothetical protein